MVLESVKTLRCLAVREKVGTHAARKALPGATNGDWEEKFRNMATKAKGSKGRYLSRKNDIQQYSVRIWIPHETPSRSCSTNRGNAIACPVKFDLPQFNMFNMFATVPGCGYV